MRMCDLGVPLPRETQFRLDVAGAAAELAWGVSRTASPIPVVSTEGATWKAGKNVGNPSSVERKSALSASGSGGRVCLGRKPQGP